MDTVIYICILRLMKHTLIQRFNLNLSSTAAQADPAGGAQARVAGSGGEALTTFCTTNEGDLVPYLALPPTS